MIEEEGSEVKGSGSENEGTGLEELRSFIPTG